MGAMPKLGGGRGALAQWHDLWLPIASAPSTKRLQHPPLVEFCPSSSRTTHRSIVLCLFVSFLGPSIRANHRRAHLVCVRYDTSRVPTTPLHDPTVRGSSWHVTNAVPALAPPIRPSPLVARVRRNAPAVIALVAAPPPPIHHRHPPQSSLACSPISCRTQHMPTRRPPRHVVVDPTRW